MSVTLAGVVVLAPTFGSSVGDPPNVGLSEQRVSEWVEDAGWLVSAPLDAQTVVLVGASWDGDAHVQMRAIDDGAWGRWVDFHRDHDHAPDGHDVDDHAESRTDPVWIGAADSVQVRVRATTDRTPHVDLQMITMSGGNRGVYEPTRVARGAAIATSTPPGAPPEIVPRSEWDPEGECKVREPSDVSEDGYSLAHVHHTVMYPRYAPDEADDVVRALCIFHTELRGWSDLGYNFLVDRYGRIYEGRAGSLDRPIVGSHAAGFNHASVGVTVVGDFERNPVPEATLDAISRLLAWQFSVYRIHPLGAVAVESTGGAVPGLTRFAKGETVQLPTIIGHRDTGSNTLCPGRFLYDELHDMPERVADVMVAAGYPIEELEREPDEQTAASGPGETAAAATGRPPASGDGPLSAPPAQGLPTTTLVVSAVGVLVILLAAGGRRWRRTRPVTSAAAPRRRRTPSAELRRPRRSG